MQDVVYIDNDGTEHPARVRREYQIEEDIALGNDRYRKSNVQYGDLSVYYGRTRQMFIEGKEVNYEVWVPMFGVLRSSDRTTARHQRCYRVAEDTPKAPDTQITSELASMRAKRRKPPRLSDVKEEIQC